MGKSRGKASGKGPFGGALGLHKPGSSGGVRMAGQSPFGLAIGQAEGQGKMKKSPMGDFMQRRGGGKGRRWGLGGASAKGMGGAVSAATQDKDPNCPT
jgi:hypothetical protein